MWTNNYKSKNLHLVPKAAKIMKNNKKDTNN